MEKEKTKKLSGALSAVVITTPRLGKVEMER